MSHPLAFPDDLGPQPLPPWHGLPPKQAVDWGENEQPKRRKCCRDGDAPEPWHLRACWHQQYKLFEIRDAYGVVVNKFAACDKCQKIGKPVEPAKKVLTVQFDE